MSEINSKVARAIVNSAKKTDSTWEKLVELKALIDEIRLRNGNKPLPGESLSENEALVAHLRHENLQLSQKIKKLEAREAGVQKLAAELDTQVGDLKDLKDRMKSHFDRAMRIIKEDEEHGKRFKEWSEQVLKDMDAIAEAQRSVPRELPPDIFG